MPPDSKEIKLGSSNQEASPSAGKKKGSFNNMSHMEICPYSYFRLWGYFWGPWVSFATTADEVHKN